MTYEIYKKTNTHHLMIKNGKKFKFISLQTGDIHLAYMVKV